VIVRELKDLCTVIIAIIPGAEKEKMYLLFIDI
jgi:hypothetical protein